MFHDDYITMQIAMIYGESPDFNTLIEKLKILNQRFRMISEN
jgi:hypothetical protein